MHLDCSFFNMLDGCANIQYYDVDFDENIPQIDSKDATGNFNGHCTEAAELVTPIGVEDGMAYHRRENSLILGKVRIFMIRSVSLSTTFTS